MVLVHRELTYQSPVREEVRCPAAAGNGKGEHEDHDLSAAVESCAEQEIVFAEPRSTVPAVESVRLLDTGGGYP